MVCQCRIATDSYDAEELNDAYLDIVRSAWLASRLPGAVTFSTALKLVTQNDAQLDGMEREVVEKLLPTDRINAFPEFSALSYWLCPVAKQPGGSSCDRGCWRRNA